MELANTVCELLEWKRPNGGLKGRECWAFLDQLEADGRLQLPATQRRRPFGSRTRVPLTPRGDPAPALVGTVGEFAPVVLERVRVPDQRALFRELVGRYHYLGHAMPFGAHVRYLVYLATPVRRVVGCVQFSSAAWRIAVRDHWIGWSDAQRRRQLARVVNNSRFLILPWVRVKNLASRVLALSTRRLVAEWHEQYGVAPWLVETLVEPARYVGTCYRAANWLALGLTTGRGRMDRTHQRHGAAPKMVWVYPLVNNATEQLRGGGHGRSR
jgi:Druantia protein DruA